MRQLASSTKSDGHAKNLHGMPVNAAESAADRMALEQRCERLERMVSELLLKNEELRMRLLGKEKEA